MATHADRFTDAAVRAARQAKKWAEKTAREADRLLTVAGKRADTEIRRRHLKQALGKTGRVLRVAGEAALVAAVTAGIAALQSERGRRKLARGRSR